MNLLWWVVSNIKQYCKEIKAGDVQDDTLKGRGLNRRRSMQALLDAYMLLLMCIYVSSSCQLQGQFHLNGMHKAGDVMLGGLFEINFFAIFPDLSFTAEPEHPSCHG